MRTRTFLIANLLLASAALHAGGNKQDASVDTKAAFARLKTLTGEWQADTKMGKAHLSYELIAGGASLVERVTGENMPAMLTVYYLDGNRLMLTHYCMAGNQPRMQAHSFDPKTGELQFQFLDATNLSNGGGHMHNATLRLSDNDHFTADWEFFEGGLRKTNESFQYTRVR
jgi:hypothetical protein